MRNSKAMMSILAMSAMYGDASDDWGDFQEKVKSPEEKARLLEEKKLRNADKLKLAKGLKEFFYSGGNSVWASNQKVADKKALKKGYISILNYIK